MGRNLSSTYVLYNKFYWVLRTFFFRKLLIPNTISCDLLTSNILSGKLIAKLCPCFNGKSLYFQNGETCLHAAAISGSPQLVQVVLDAGGDPEGVNSGGQTPLDLLMMFINYGNISLTPNLMRVLHLLPGGSTSTDSCTSSENDRDRDLITHPGSHKLHKLIKIYSPFSITKVRLCFCSSAIFWKSRSNEEFIKEQCSHVIGILIGLSYLLCKIRRWKLIWILVFFSLL